VLIVLNGRKEVFDCSLKTVFRSFDFSNSAKWPMPQLRASVFRLFPIIFFFLQSLQRPSETVLTMESQDDIFGADDQVATVPADSEVPGKEPESDMNVLEDELFGDDNEPVEEAPKVEVKNESAEDRGKITNAVAEILKNSNLNEITINGIKEQLSSSYNIDTKEHKQLIKEIIESQLAEQQELIDNDETNGEAAEGDELDDVLGKRNTEVVSVKKKRPSGKL
jgi:hypothetical protein